MARRGQLQIPFHFIFALVGGFLFLLFFFILIKSVLHSEESTTSYENAFHLETSLYSALSTPDTFSVITVPNNKYTIACVRDDNGIESYIRIGSSDSYDPNALRYVPLFAPRSVEGDQLFTATLTWRAPFPVTSLLVASNNRTRYVFVGDTENAEEFIESMNLGGFGHDIIDDLPGYEDEGFDQYRFIFLEGFEPGMVSQSFRETFGKKATLLAVETSLYGDYSSGTMIFYNDPLKLDQKLTAPYYGEAMLAAGIFSGNSKIFSCNMVKVFERLNMTVQILQERIDELPESQECTPSYSLAKAYLDGYRTPYGLFASVADDPTNNNILALQNVNEDVRAFGCPAVY